MAAEGRVAKAGLLEREQIERPRAVKAGIAAAVLGFAAALFASLTQGTLPRVTLLDSLDVAAGRNIGRAGLTSDLLEHVDDKALPYLTTAFLQGLSLTLYGFVLVVLFRAITGRGHPVPRVAQMMAASGAVLGGLGSIGLQVDTQLHVRSAISEEDWLTRPASDRSTMIFQLILLLAVMGLAVATIMIGLGAMRAGLLTRFLGWVGVGVGATMVLTVLPTGGTGFNSFQMAWALLVAVALSGRAPNGRPPAWDAGEAVAWPTQQELREQATRETARKTGPVSAAPSPATSQRKRKKRR